MLAFLVFGFVTMAAASNSPILGVWTKDFLQQIAGLFKSFRVKIGIQAT